MIWSDLMPEKTIKLTGWKAAIAAIVLLILLGVRVMTFSNSTDEELLEALNMQLMSEFYPNQVERLKAALDQTDEEKIESGTSAVLNSELNILSVQTSYPFLDFSSPQNVVVKVTYNLDDETGKKEKYYLFKHGVIGNNWQYQYESNVISYYLNFL